jgi:tRNA U34 5-methylaminomethyl-2-thiouridine-forming methyltransferase MnmC
MKTMKYEPQIILTEDGSNTLYVDSIDEYYHSRYGAVQESNHVFIAGGLKSVKKSQISILEVGLGTGLNVLLTYITARKEKMNIQYDAIELFPIENLLAEKLNYTRIMDFEHHQFLSQLHKLPWNRINKLDDRFAFQKILKDFIHFIPARQYDLVYFDAFAPDKQPKMWDEQNFQRLFQSMETGGILVTYCAKGEIKRRLKRIGFTVELIKGPPGKHEMIRAVKAQ